MSPDQVFSQALSPTKRSRNLAPSAILTVKGKTFHVVGDRAHECLIPLRAELVPALEAFVYDSTPSGAFALYQQANSQAMSDPGTLSLLRSKLFDEFDNPSDYDALVAQGVLRLVHSSDGHQKNASRLSPDIPLVLLALYDVSAPAGYATSQHAFDRLARELVDIGALSPAVGEVMWGDLDRAQPLCYHCGFTRGTPVDRYYLANFVNSTRELVRGKVLEIGGQLQNKNIYGYNSYVTEYLTLELHPGPETTYVGDVHDPTLFAPNTFDTLVAFNILEHCLEPWTVIKNLYQWLNPKGVCLVMVPYFQKLHDRPIDMWRFSPLALRRMFAMFKVTEIQQYGNPRAAIASLLGIAAEELSLEKLDHHHIDYPVAICVAASK